MGPALGEAGLLEKMSGATGRVVVALLGSNVARLTTLAQVALATGRYPGSLGRSLANYYRAARASRLAAGNHPDLDLEPGDTVIFSSRVIPGNERALEVLDARIQAMGINVIHDVEGQAPIHASGHPARDELRDMYQWIRPQIAVPVHGEGHHLDAHAALASELAVPVQLNGRNGDLFLLAPQPGLRRGAAPVGKIELRR